MTGYDVFNRAIMLLGYTYPDGGITANNALLNRACDVIGQICSDLGVQRIETLDGELNIGEKTADALLYGTAMLLSLTEGDAVKNQLFTQLYNAKRSAALASLQSVGDVLPTDDGGVD